MESGKPARSAKVHPAGGENGLGKREPLCGGQVEKRKAESGKRKILEGRALAPADLPPPILISASGRVAFALRTGIAAATAPTERGPTENSTCDVQGPVGSRPTPAEKVDRRGAESPSPGLKRPRNAPGLVESGKGQAGRCWYIGVSR
jgi:hypothetical protein